ncbi:hypothetical protein [Halobellus salinisoli]|uniref:hypothetical protein n=1 Tax=Halobellus salinisoli TaxID=3108500 RepID=UPI003007F42B
MVERTAPITDSSPESVRRSLRALADGSAPSERPSTSHVTDDRERVTAVVRDGDEATSCARAAVAFLLDGRLDELDAAVAAAERERWVEIARRGRRARATLRALDLALHDISDAKQAANGQQAANKQQAPNEPHGARAGRDDDHFRPARGTVLGRSDQSGDR